MTIHLSKDLEKFVQDAVRDGLYAREHDVIRDALLRLKQTMPGQKTKHAKPAQQKKKPLTRAEFDQKLLDLGLMSQLPDTAADFDDPDDEPIAILRQAASELDALLKEEERRRHAFDFASHGGDPFGRGAAAAADQVDPAVAGELA